MFDDLVLLSGSVTDLQSCLSRLVGVQLALSNTFESVWGDLLFVLQSMYLNIKCPVNIYGMISEPICLSAGVKQGCPWSSVIQYWCYWHSIDICQTCDPVNVHTCMLNTNCIRLQMTQFSFQSQSPVFNHVLIGYKIHVGFGYKTNVIIFKGDYKIAWFNFACMATELKLFIFTGILGLFCSLPLIAFQKQ